jgi:hypothetical protein
VLGNIAEITGGAILLESEKNKINYCKIGM